MAMLLRFVIGLFVMQCCLLFSMMSPEIVGEAMPKEQLYESVNLLLSLQSNNGGSAAWEPVTGHQWLEVSKMLLDTNSIYSSNNFLGRIN